MTNEADSAVMFLCQIDLRSFYFVS